MKRTFCLLAVVSWCAAAPVAAQSITVLSPNGGESWTIGSSQTITWRPTGTTDGFNVVLFRGEANVGRIAYRLPPSATSYVWTSVGRLADGTVVPAGTDYKIAVRSVSTTVEDRSDRVLSLVAAATLVAARDLRELRLPTRVQVTQPNRLQLFRMPVDVEITWTSQNGRTGQMVQVSLVRFPAGCHVAAGAEVTSIGMAPLSAGRLISHFAESFPPCEDCVIRLTPVEPGDFLPDDSDECFVLRRTTTVRILAPNGGERFRRGAPINVSWDIVNPRSGQFQYLAITYDPPSCHGVRRRVLMAPIETRSHTWPGDPTLPAGQYGFYLTVGPAGRGEAEDWTDGCFTLY